MEEYMNILVDGMGGDNAPAEIIKGVLAAAPKVDGKITVIGREDAIRECLSRSDVRYDNIFVVDAKEIIENDEAPAMAVRRKKDSSVVKGMTMLREGEADAFISAGSTGALLAAGLLNLGRIKGIKRPAIAALYPKVGKKGTTLLLDCGASVDAKPQYLVQYAIMGSIFCEKVKGIKDPSVMLLNVGAEDAKGDDLRKEAFEALKNTPINFAGNIEARDVPAGDCDVVVTDGFSGNVFLKASEGVASMIMHVIKDKLKEGFISKIGAAMMLPKFRELKKSFDYSDSGAAPILGLKGAVFKMHGSSKADAVYNAILKSIPYIENDVTGIIEQAIKDYG